MGPWEVTMDRISLYHLILKQQNVFLPCKSYIRYVFESIIIDHIG